MADTPLETMQSRLTELRSQTAELDDELLKLTNKPTLTPDEDERYSDLWAERETIIPELTKLEERAQRAEQIKATKTRELAGVPNFQRPASEYMSEDVTKMDYRHARDGALRTLADRDANWTLTDNQKGVLERRVRVDTDLARRILATENDHYRTAFMKATMDPSPVFSPEENYALLRWKRYQDLHERAQSTTTTAGGFAIPVFIDPSFILTDQETNNPFLTLASLEDNVQGNIWKGISGAGVSWSFDAENAEVSDDSVTLAQPSATVFMARGFIPFSIEIGQDWPGFQAEMSRLLAAGYDELLVNKLTNGNGTTEPQGVITGCLANTASTRVLVQTSGSFGAVDVYKLWKSLAQKYRRQATFMSSVDIDNRLRQFGTANQMSDYTVNLTAEASDVVFGKQWYENPYMSDLPTVTSSGANMLLVGDFKNFKVIRRAGMTVELVPTLFATNNARPTGQRGWFAYARVGSTVANPTGFKILLNT
jgi:HK97 family phage major capsid protein